jgi:hypothetical protein
MSEKRTILETSEKDVRVNFPGDTFNPTQSAVCVSICEVDNTDPSNPTPKDGSAHPSVGSQVIRGVNYIKVYGDTDWLDPLTIQLSGIIVPTNITSPMPG